MARPWALAFLACSQNPHRFTEDASWRYRADNLARALAERGHALHLGHHRAGTPWRPDLVLLHRPMDGWRLRRQLRAWRAAGVPVIADFDDLVFEPALAADSPGVLNLRLPLDEVQRRFTAHRRLLGALDGFTDRKSTRLNSSHSQQSRMPSSA